MVSPLAAGCWPGELLAGYCHQSSLMSTVIMSIVKGKDDLSKITAKMVEEEGWIAEEDDQEGLQFVPDKAVTPPHSCPPPRPRPRQKYIKSQRSAREPDDSPSTRDGAGR